MTLCSMETNENLEINQEKKQENYYEDVFGDLYLWRSNNVDDILCLCDKYIKKLSLYVNERKKEFIVLNKTVNISIGLKHTSINRTNVFILLMQYILKKYIEKKTLSVLNQMI
jgi:hypothetical protein